MPYDYITSLHGFQTKKGGGGGVFDFFLVTFVDFSLISRRSKKKGKKGGRGETDRQDRQKCRGKNETNSAARLC